MRSAKMKKRTKATGSAEMRLMEAERHKRQVFRQHLSLQGQADLGPFPASGTFQLGSRGQPLGALAASCKAGVLSQRAIVKGSRVFKAPITVLDT